MGKGMEGIRLADHTDMVQEQLSGPLLMITAGAADKRLLAEAVDNSTLKATLLGLSSNGQMGYQRLKTRAFLCWKVCLN